MPFEFEFTSLTHEPRPTRVRFDRMPIHIHQVPVLPRHRVVRLKPGIHYAVQSCKSEDRLREHLRASLEDTVNGQGLPLAGPNRGRLPWHIRSEVSADFFYAEMDALYEVGINPLKQRVGAIFVWGNMFVDQLGRTHRMIERCDRNHTGWKIHPELYNW